MPPTDTKKWPYCPIYIGDVLVSAAELPNDAFGVYLKLLLFQWNKGSIPNDPQRLASMTGEPLDLFLQMWKGEDIRLSDKFQCVNGNNSRLQNLRMEIHRKEFEHKSRVRSEAGKKGADSRWEKE